MNHYQVGSCEYFTRVKMTRGSVILSRNDKMRNFNWFTWKDKSQRRNLVVDDELRLKRSPGWLAQCERTVQPTWPNRSRVGGHGLARAFKLPVDALGSHCFGNLPAGLSRQPPSQIDPPTSKLESSKAGRIAKRVHSQPSAPAPVIAAMFAAPPTTADSGCTRADGSGCPADLSVPG